MSHWSFKHEASIVKLPAGLIEARYAEHMANMALLPMTEEGVRFVRSQAIKLWSTAVRLGIVCC